MVGEAPLERETDHEIRERERLPDGALRAGLHVEGAGQVREERTVHRRRPPAAHLVPVIAGELELRLRRHLHLRQGDQVVESGLACDLLGEEPTHLGKRGRLREPGEEGIALPRSGLAQGLEPAYERVGPRRSLRRALHDGCALGLEELHFQRTEEVCVAFERRAIGQGGLQPLAREAVQRKVQLPGVHRPCRMSAGRASCTGLWGGSHGLQASRPTTAMRSAPVYGGFSSSSPNTSGSSSKYSWGTPCSKGASRCRSRSSPSTTAVPV